MKFSHLLEAIHHRPWFITPAGHATVAALVERKVKAKELKAIGQSEPLTDFFGAPLPTMTIDPVTKLATIPVQGVMARGVGSLEKMCGACDTNDVIANIQEAESSEIVKSVLFEYNTPGGTVDGTAELGDAIAGMKKPNAAWIMSQCCSAGYWAAAQNQRIFGAMSCEVGSIGVLISSKDVTTMRAMGLTPDINVTRPTGAPLKAPGAFATPITPVQEAWIQARADYLHELFMSAVQAGRPNVSPAAMQGQTFMGPQCVDAGLVDELCTRDYAVASLL